MNSKHEIEYYAKYRCTNGITSAFSRHVVSARAILRRMFITRQKLFSEQPSLLAEITYVPLED
jgi:hypothetical protein